MIDRWWCEDPPVRHIHLRQGQKPSEPPWSLITTRADQQPQQHDYASETDARAAAQAMMAGSPGHWQRQPASRAAAPRRQ